MDVDIHFHFDKSSQYHLAGPSFVQVAQCKALGSWYQCEKSEYEVSFDDGRSMSPI